ncbi:MAG: hypothetical protein Q9217_003416 [Psora testacea]
MTVSNLPNPQLSGVDDEENRKFKSQQDTQCEGLKIGGENGARSVTDSASSVLSGCGTPPIPVVRKSTRPKPEFIVEKAIQVTQDYDLTPPIAAAERLTEKAARRKKRGAKKNPIAALNSHHGFTPATSGDSDSDFSVGSFRGRKGSSTTRSGSVVRKDLNLGSLSGTGIGFDGRSSSPSPGVSALRQQLDTIRVRSGSERPPVMCDKSKLASETSSASATSATNSDDESTGSTSYEIPLEHDFISSAVSEKDKRDARQDPLFNGGVVRKMQASDFNPLRCLGKGTYGTVLLVKQASTGKLYAQKQFRKASLTVRKRLVEQTKTERTILESINRHPFVVKLYYAFQDHEKLYLILEYAQGGELFERMRNQHMFPEETAAFYMAEMVLALEHLHKNIGVIYRDLKPENCLLDAEGHLLLTDFGLSKVAAHGEECRSITGTIEYMAPEVIQEQQYGTGVDWWSFGILGYDLMTGSTPFSAHNDLKIKEKILKSKLVLPYYLSPDAKDLLTRLLRKEPKKRLGASMPKDMQTIRGHRFFRKIDWYKLDRRELEPPIKPLITDPELAENFSSEFTNLAVSPVTACPWDVIGVQNEHDPFGGFSFVGSRSLLEDGLACI